MYFSGSKKICAEENHREEKINNCKMDLEEKGKVGGEDPTLPPVRAVGCSPDGHGALARATA
jgi:hypothetical protein